jgi:CBS domain-containing protein
MTKDPKWCLAGDTLDRAAKLMWDYDCGCLPVCSGDDGGRVTGMITDRDICMSAFFQGKPLRDIRVSEAMAKNPRVCRPGDSLGEAESIMREARVRRLPVVGDDGGLLGMISMADLAREAARERTAVRKEITEKEVGDTLAAICQPTSQRLAA